MDRYASISWEQICQQHVLHEAADVTAVGRWWGRVPTWNRLRTEEREIDVVGVNAAGAPVVIGMCKWTNSEVDFDELNLLDRLSQHVEGLTAPVTRYLFSRAGFSKRLTEYATTDPMLRLVTPAGIYD